MKSCTRLASIVAAMVLVTFVISVSKAFAIQGRIGKTSSSSFAAVPDNLSNEQAPLGTRTSTAVAEKGTVPSKRSRKKFIVVTGGVISGIGKGVTASSVGVLMKMLRVKPTAIKIDPYLNADAGTMSPFEHGECFVLDDGGETDLDLGNYERFLDVRLTNDSNLTTGKVYQSVIAKERRGEYLGKTVQIIPHITNEIIERILAVAQCPVEEVVDIDSVCLNAGSYRAGLADGQSAAAGEAAEVSAAEPDVCVIELGGTIGRIYRMAIMLTHIPDYASHPPPIVGTVHSLLLWQLRL